MDTPTCGRLTGPRRGMKVCVKTVTRIKGTGELTRSTLEEELSGFSPRLAQGRRRPT